MRTNTAPVIRLEDYAPPAYLVDHVELEFVLTPRAEQREKLQDGEVLVVARSKMRPNAGTVAGTPLVLDGGGLTLDHVSLKAGDGEWREPEHEVGELSLTISQPPAGAFELSITTTLRPDENTQLSGLYRSNGIYCTQCEAQGFRRITYFPDRPDVLATYTVHIRADEADFPVALSNGNPAGNTLSDDGVRVVTWHDPHPKPSYLFALVAGRLDKATDRFTTASGREVELNIYVEPGKVPQTHWAMDCLIRSMRWDEEAYGREYDLDVFNIVAVSDFNMGAMENKGLNVFNDKYILADANIATDADFAHIEAIIAHEYFHNWTGNRITCRDWFQLCLKEGLTVYRDQQFSADMRNEAVQRIQQVRLLKAGQFTEDGGPLAHSVRPAAYREINNFYTATVYQKGAELVRMLATIVGPEGYRRATDLYFERHDGEAAMVEDWLHVFGDACDYDTTQFARWYEQAGTPHVTARGSFEGDTYTLSLTQITPDTPGQTDKKPVVIPLRFTLMAQDGTSLAATTDATAVRNDVILLTEAEQTVRFTGLSQRPVLSLLQGFSAPVILDFDESAADRLVRAAHDTDGYNRWEALSGLARVQLAEVASGQRETFEDELARTLAATASDDALDDAFRAAALTLPSEQDIAQTLGSDIDPDAVYSARRRLMADTGRALGADGIALALAKNEAQQTADPLDAVGERALSCALWPLLLAGEVDGAREAVEEVHRSATTMTVRAATLAALAGMGGEDAGRDALFDTFLAEFEGEPLVVDKWFSMQAIIAGSEGLARVEELLRHPLYTLSNPNRARSLLAPFVAANASAFHREDGRGAELFTRTVTELDASNPQLAARLLSLMNSWRQLEPVRAQHAKTALEWVKAQDSLSVDSTEIVERALG